MKNFAIDSSSTTLGNIFYLYFETKYLMTAIPMAPMPKHANGDLSKLNAVNGNEVEILLNLLEAEILTFWFWLSIMGRISRKVSLSTRISSPLANLIRDKPSFPSWSRGSAGNSPGRSWRILPTRLDNAVLWNVWTCEFYFWFVQFIPLFSAQLSSYFQDNDIMETMTSQAQLVKSLFNCKEYQSASKETATDKDDGICFFKSGIHWYISYFPVSRWHWYF